MQRRNFVRHGEANGVVLDTSDFIHTKPEGMAKPKLRIGDSMQADGDAQNRDERRLSGRSRESRRQDAPLPLIEAAPLSAAPATRLG